MGVIKYLLLLPLLYLFTNDFFNDENRIVRISSYKTVSPNKVNPLFSGKTTASGSKENKLTQSQAEDVFYKKVPVTRFEPKPANHKPKTQVNNTQGFSPVTLILSGVVALTEGEMPKDKNSIVALLLLFVALYKTQELITSKK